MRILHTRSIAAASLAAVLIAGLAACGDDDNKATAASETGTSAGTNPETGAGAEAPTAVLTPATTGNPFADTRTAASHMPMTATALATGIAKAAKIKGDVEAPAAKLRSDLTYLLTDHVYLAGIAVATAYHAGADSEAFKAAAASVDANSVDVAKAVGSVVPDKEKAFLQSWRSHVTDFVNYAVGAKTGGAEGKKMKADAVKSLTAYAKASGKFFNEITAGALPAKAVETSFAEHIGTLAEAVDSFAAGDGKGYAKLKIAGDHMSMSAKALAAGIAKAAKIEGNSNSAASELRANLTSELVTHTYLAGIAVFAAYTDKDTINSAGFKAAAAALDKNSVDLGKAVGSVAGAEKEKAFLQVWRQHISDFVDYAVGTATSDQATKDKAITALDAYRTTAGGFFSEITAGALPADAVAAELKTHIETLFGAIESLKKALLPA